MFTGLIETLGTIRQIRPPVLMIEAELGDIKNGDSVSINGACLTVTNITKAQGNSAKISFDLSPETLRRTSLNNLKISDNVNVERALKLSDRIGGHIVTGHVEATAKIQNIIKTGSSYDFLFKMPHEAARYIAEKGSIAVDGISLTVASRDKNTFSVAVIPYTFQNTNLKFKNTGDIVNIEPDILSKYVENILNNGNGANKVSLDFLKKNGF